MGLATRASSSSTISAGTASTDGETSGATEARGRTIRCMEAENSPGQMAVSMLVITTKIKRKEKVRSNGLMVGCIKVLGKTVNSMAVEISKTERVM